jgi:hypothetical protein
MNDARTISGSRRSGTLARERWRVFGHRGRLCDLNPLSGPGKDRALKIKALSRGLEAFLQCVV